MGNSPNVASPYITESGHPDRVTVQDETGDVRSQEYTKFLEKDTLEENVHGNQQNSRDQEFLLSPDSNNLEASQRTLKERNRTSGFWYEYWMDDERGQKPMKILI